MESNYRIQLLIQPPCNGGKKGKQTIGFGFHHPIALADTFFEARTVEDGDESSAIFDHSGLRQFTGRFRDAFAAHTQHIGDQFLGHLQVYSTVPVQAEQHHRHSC